MRLTRHTDNALRALIYLGIHAEDAPCRITDIARRMGMSEDHLSKVVARLAQLGYVETTRGRDGGVRLSRPPSQIKVGEVVRGTEDNLALVEALRAFFAVLDGYTLADFTARPRALTRLLEA